MIIEKGARTPEYFGAVARSQGQKEDQNPYVKDDPRGADWIAGYRSGRIEGRPLKARKYES